MVHCIQDTLVARQPVFGKFPGYTCLDYKIEHRGRGSKKKDVLTHPEDVETESREGNVGQSGENQGSDLTRAEIDTVFVTMLPADWKRAERLSAFAVRGVSGKTGDDLLQETIEQLLAGRRRYPRGIHPLVVLKTAMRSNASNARKVERGNPIRDTVAVIGHSMEKEGMGGVEGQDRRTPLVELEAKEALDAIAKVVEDDDSVSLVAMAWSDGLRGAEAAEASGLTGKEYDAARKRLLRKLAPHAADRSEP